MRIAALSDVHGSDLPDLNELKNVNLLLMAGDLEPCYGPRKESIDLQLNWLRGPFKNFLKECEQEGIHVVCAFGNHSFWGDYRHLADEWVNQHFYQSETVEFNGLKIHVEGCTPTFGYGWAFNRSEEQLKELFKLVPENTDILLTHGAPYGILDLVENGRKHAGSKSLRQRIEELPDLQLCLFGHLHLQGGQIEKIGKTTFANVSRLNEQYQFNGEPIRVFEL